MPLIQRENTCPLCKLRFTQMYQVTRTTRNPLRDQSATQQPIDVTERNQEHNPRYCSLYPVY